MESQADNDSCLFVILALVCAFFLLLGVLFLAGCGALVFFVIRLGGAL